jgi:hypothetical protein
MPLLQYLAIMVQEHEQGTSGSLYPYSTTEAEIEINYQHNMNRVIVSSLNFTINVFIYYFFLYYFENGINTILYCTICDLLIQILLWLVGMDKPKMCGPL